MTFGKFNYPGDLPDARDLILEKLPFENESRSVNGKIDIYPPIYDLRTLILPHTMTVLAQGDLGSCTSCALSNALRFCHLKQMVQSNVVVKLGLDFQPSILFIYYFARRMAGYPENVDTGVAIRTALYTVSKHGVPPERFCPYIIENFSQQPSDRAEQQARQYASTIRYMTVPQTLDMIKYALRLGNPVLMALYMHTGTTSEYTLSTGYIKMAIEGVDKPTGPHAMALYGWDDSTQHFLVMNSWSSQFGDSGWFYVPYEYILNVKLCIDLWMVQSFY